MFGLEDMKDFMKVIEHFIKPGVTASFSDQLYNSPFKTRSLLWKEEKSVSV